MEKKNNKIVYILVGIVLLAFPFAAEKVFNWNYGVLLANFMILYIIAVSGLDILFGYSGQISMGHAAFFCIGAYGSVLLHEFTGLPVLITILIGTVLATLIGSLLAYPASKLVFHFLSLATIAFGEVVYQLVAQSPGNITGNFTGKFTETISLFGFKLNTYTKYYFFSVVCMVIFLIIKTNLVRSRVGRAFIAIRENSHAANGMGINVRKYKVIAFATSAFYTAFAGGLYAHLVRFISPDTFTQKQSVMFLTMLLFGGSASVGGTVTGVFTVQFLNEILRSAERYQLLIYGVLLLVVILAFPGGLFGLVKQAIKKVKTRKEANANASAS
ncbi:MAG: branched-chain amino acid ABC transporter permease [Lachnospiraceae bacterium]|uniref:Branched-chain amino acid ABC transporter permease n=2 Tax=Lachnospiraceae TaxID=186803 RepID=A0A9D2TCV8_9FIRM|nr:branched-chain amino acid ABC transporter permease [Lachnospiraceae bacterium]HIR05604.1 branched-chain amino acid ABC transporter permease [Candidatus Copromonas faecavium]HJC65274.1 branched-chain amino acid ABC transporter permease [Candidatus Enterocloster excrementigallinarum]